MVRVHLAKPNRDTNLFNKNQKCWVLNFTGSCDLRVVGKHKGKGRYIIGWLHDGEWDKIIEIEVTEDFYNNVIYGL